MKMNPEHIQQEKAETSESKRRRKIVWFYEIGIVVVCAVFFLAFFSALIDIYFPEGTALVDAERGDRLDDLRDTGDVILGIDSQSSTMPNSGASNRRKRMTVVPDGWAS